MQNQIATKTELKEKWSYIEALEYNEWLNMQDDMQHAAQKKAEAEARRKGGG